MGNNLVSSFPQRLKECLEENSAFTATTLAQEIGLSKQAISMYISGDRKPKRPTMKAISDALGVNLAWLMGYDVEKILPSAPASITLTDYEQKVILAYRSKPEIQPAIDLLLEDQECCHLVNKYARLDHSDKIRVSERIDVMLEDEKYTSAKKVLKNA